jgi:hypothetical protein
MAETWTLGNILGTLLLLVVLLAVGAAMFYVTRGR